METKKVSIIMPTYNSAKFIGESITSVLNQTYADWELIIVDDCSTDNTEEIVTSFGDERIRYIKNEVNSGAAVSRNRAIDLAQGKWIAFLDSDDLYKSEKLEKQIAFMEEKNSPFSCTHYEVINDENETMAVFRPKQEEYDYENILKHCSIGCLTAMYDAEKLGKVYMPENAVKREDFACWLSILKTGEKVSCLHEDLATYRVHTGSVSSNKFKMIKYQWNVYRHVEKISFFKSLYYMCHWAINGLFKYKNNK